MFCENVCERNTMFRGNARTGGTLLGNCYWRWAAALQNFEACVNAATRAANSDHKFHPELEPAAKIAAAAVTTSADSPVRATPR
jgi:hypothetical protein